MAETHVSDMFITMAKKLNEPVQWFKHMIIIEPR
jgi:hypothetical protein